MVQTEAKASRVVAGFSSVLVLRLSRADSVGMESLTSAEHFPSLHTVFPSSQTPREVVAWILQVRKLSSRGPGAGQTSCCPTLLRQKASYRAGQLSQTELTAAPQKAPDP